MSPQHISYRLDCGSLSVCGDCVDGYSLLLLSLLLLFVIVIVAFAFAFVFAFVVTFVANPDQ